VLKLTLREINEEFISSLENICKKNKGKTQLSFNISLPEERLTVEMFSRNSPISFNNEVLNYLNENNMDFKLN
jgi:hypothetical protein